MVDYFENRKNIIYYYSRLIRIKASLQCLFRYFGSALAKELVPSGNNPDVPIEFLDDASFFVQSRDAAVNEKRA